MNFCSSSTSTEMSNMKTTCRRRQLQSRMELKKREESLPNCTKLSAVIIETKMSDDSCKRKSTCTPTTSFQWVWTLITSQATPWISTTKSVCSKKHSLEELRSQLTKSTLEQLTNFPDTVRHTVSQSIFSHLKNDLNINLIWVNLTTNWSVGNFKLSENITEGESCIHLWNNENFE